MITFQAGDVIFVSSPSFMGNVIRFFTRQRGESPTRVNHVGIMVDGDNLIESLDKVYKLDLYRRYGQPSKYQVAIFRKKDLTKKQQYILIDAAHSYLGRKYGWFKILAHFMDWLFGGVYLFRRLALMDKYPICSWLVAHCYKKIDYEFGIAPNAASPDDMWDWCTDNKGKVQWECIHPLGLLQNDPTN